ncbi:DNA-directed RNA polymerase subunit omega, partial [Dysosmobacter welbionis]
VLRVHTGSRLIQNHDGGVLQNGAGNGDPLLLAAGEGGAALSHHRMIAVGQRHDKVVALGAPGRLHHLLVSGVGIAEFDVVLNG